MNTAANHELFEAANTLQDAGNHKLAFDLFMQSHRAGDRWADNSIGHCFDAGFGVAQNRERAMAWYRKAAMSGDRCGCANLAACYLDSGNIRRARIWFLRAHAMGDDDSAIELAKIFLKSKWHNAKSDALKYLGVAVNSTNITESGREDALHLQAHLLSLSQSVKNGTKKKMRGQSNSSPAN